VPTIKQFLDGLFEQKAGAWCAFAQKLVKEDSADTYNGTNRPDFWCQVLAYTNLTKAKAVIVQAIHNAAADLDPGDLRTKLESLTVSLTAEEYDALIAWAKPLRRGVSFPKLHSALYSAAIFLKTEAQDKIKAPVIYLIDYEREKSTVRLSQARETFYTFLRSEVTLEEWRGSYT